MTLSILPDFEVYHSILRRELTFTGVSDCREAYEKAVFLNVKHNVRIILPKLIEDKIKNIIVEAQKSDFYSIVDKDNSTSADAGDDFNSCLSRTAKTNSFKERVIILTNKEAIPNQELIEKNKKIVLMQPHKFVTLFGAIRRISVPTENFKNFFIYQIFFNTIKLNEFYENFCKSNQAKKSE